MFNDWLETSKNTMKAIRVKMYELNGRINFEIVCE